VATLVCFHAHPDDEAIATGGVMAQAAEAGHRVVLVVATRGEVGEVAPGFLAPGEELWERRVAEVAAAAEILGVARVEYLGYRDSGMMGTPTNDDPASFWRADVDDAAAKLAALLIDEDAAVLTVYDDNGGYGHPDHIQVHRVGVRAGELAATPRVYEATMDQDAIRDRLRETLLSRPNPQMVEMAEGMLADGGPHMGVPAAKITTRVDVSAFIDRKRRALAAHVSQVPADSWWMSTPSEAFALMFGIECFMRRGAAAGLVEDSLGLSATGA
jgi:LmbE family N-acetylglucosaminyl deacetylase